MIRPMRFTRPFRQARMPVLIANLKSGGIFFALLLLTCGGCASRGGTLEVEPVGSERVLAQKFANAYIAQSRGGEYDIVLVDHPQYERQKSNKPLQPQPVAPARQLMRLHLYWRPRTDAMRSPAAVNASIDWHVLGSDASEDVVRYEGAGVVTIHGSGRQRRIVIEEGTVRPSGSSGAMQDPIGAARISGTFTADIDGSRVREILSEMRQSQGAGGGSGSGAQARFR